MQVLSLRTLPGVLATPARYQIWIYCGLYRLHACDHSSLFRTKSCSRPRLSSLAIANLLESAYKSSDYRLWYVRHSPSNATSNHLGNDTARGNWHSLTSRYWGRRLMVRTGPDTTSQISPGVQNTQKKMPSTPSVGRTSKQA